MTLKELTSLIYIEWVVEGTDADGSVFSNWYINTVHTLDIKCGGVESLSPSLLNVTREGTLFCIDKVVLTLSSSTKGQTE